MSIGQLLAIFLTVAIEAFGNSFLQKFKKSVEEDMEEIM